MRTKPPPIVSHFTSVLQIVVNPFWFLVALLSHNRLTQHHRLCCPFTGITCRKVKGSVKLIERVKIALLFLHVMSKLSQFTILDLSR